MHIIWIIENPNQGVLHKALIGNYAVRVFATVESAAILTKGQEDQPSLLLLAADDYVHSYDQILRKFKALPFNIPKMIFNFDSTVRGHDLHNPLEGSGHLSYHNLFSRDNFRINQVVRSALTVFHQSDWAKSSLRNERESEVYSFKDLTFHSYSLQYSLTHEGSVKSLPLKEAMILRLLIKSPGSCITREDLISEVWPDVRISPRTVDSHVSRLRRRLEEAEIEIENVYGQGYLLR